MSDGNTIAGRKKNIEYDMYETPVWATTRFIDEAVKDGILTYDDEIYECCCGAGKITSVLKEHGFSRIKESDIQEAEFISGAKGLDVYELPAKCCDVALTNPPYNLMTNNDMLMQFLRISRKKAILLLNIYFLSSEKRQAMLKKSPLRFVYIHSKRVTMHPYGTDKPKHEGTKLFSWFIWEHGYTGEPTIRLL